MTEHYLPENHQQSHLPTPLALAHRSADCSGHSQPMVPGVRSPARGLHKPGTLGDPAVQALLVQISLMPNLNLLCWMASWNSDTQQFHPELTDFGRRLRCGIENRNRTLLHYLLLEAQADQHRALEAIHS